MHIDKNLQFITDKILDTRIALLHCYSNSVLRLPNTIINTTQVDEHGNIWFYIRRPAQQTSQFDQEFPVSLKYFKKGNSYSLQVLGKAQIINEPVDLIHLGQLSPAVSLAPSDHILFMVKIIKVDFYELEPKQNLSTWGRIKYALLNLLNWSDHDAKSFDFGSATA